MAKRKGFFVKELYKDSLILLFLLKDTITSGLWGDVTHLKGNITNIVGDVTNLLSDCSGIEGDISKISGDISELSGNMTNIKANAKKNYFITTLSKITTQLIYNKTL